jgi:hypothetical protein
VKKYTFVFLLLFSTFIFCSCTNTDFQNPQPFEIKENTSIPSKYRGEYAYKGNSKFTFKKNRVEIYSEEPVKVKLENYFKKGDVDYIVYDDSAFVIYNRRFYQDSVSGDIVKLYNYEIEKNLVVKESKNWAVFNLFNADGYTPIITIIENDFLYIYMIESKVRDALKENKEDNLIIKNISSKDIDDYLLDKRANLGLIGIFDIKNKKVSYWKN